MPARDALNACRWPRDGSGHYESWFARANDAGSARALWIRYTIFEPAGRPQAAVGELWALVFEPDSIYAVKQVWPAAECSFAKNGFDLQIGGATHDDTHLRGEASTDDRTVRWDLRVTEGGAPLLLFSERMYDAKLPRAKALVPRPFARFHGTLQVGDRTIEVDDWIGSENHNWGSRHTDHYAWAQVVGFDEEPDTFLECACARLRIGPLWTPRMSPVVLRRGAQTLAFNGLLRTIRARGRFAPFFMHIETGDGRHDVEIDLHADAHRFVALTYANPPGGTKTCLNSKLARATVRVAVTGEPTRTLTSERAALEILTDFDDHGLTPVV
jgi:hypothetical protein